MMFIEHEVSNQNTYPCICSAPKVCAQVEKTFRKLQDRRGTKTSILDVKVPGSKIPPEKMKEVRIVTSALGISIDKLTDTKGRKNVSLVHYHPIVVKETKNSRKIPVQKLIECGLWGSDYNDNDLTKQGSDKCWAAPRYPVERARADAQELELYKSMGKKPALTIPTKSSVEANLPGGEMVVMNTSSPTNQQSQTPMAQQCFGSERAVGVNPHGGEMVRFNRTPTANRQSQTPMAPQWFGFQPFPNLHVQAMMHSVYERAVQNVEAYQKKENEALMRAFLASLAQPGNLHVPGQNSTSPVINATYNQSVSNVVNNHRQAGPGPEKENESEKEELKNMRSALEMLQQQNKKQAEMIEKLMTQNAPIRKEDTGVASPELEIDNEQGENTNQETQRLLEEERIRTPPLTATSPNAQDNENIRNAPHRTAVPLTGANMTSPNAQVNEDTRAVAPTAAHTTRPNVQDSTTAESVARATSTNTQEEQRRVTTVETAAIRRAASSKRRSSVTVTSSSSRDPKRAKARSTTIEIIDICDSSSDDDPGTDSISTGNAAGVSGTNTRSVTQEEPIARNRYFAPEARTHESSDAQRGTVSRSFPVGPFEARVRASYPQEAADALIQAADPRRKRRKRKKTKPARSRISSIEASSVATSSEDSDVDPPNVDSSSEGSDADDSSYVEDEGNRDLDGGSSRRVRRRGGRRRSGGGRSRRGGGQSTRSGEGGDGGQRGSGGGQRHSHGRNGQSQQLPGRGGAGRGGGEGGGGGESGGGGQHLGHGQVGESIGVARADPNRSRAAESVRRSNRVRIPPHRLREQDDREVQNLQRIVAVPQIPIPRSNPDDQRENTCFTCRDVAIRCFDCGHCCFCDYCLKCCHAGKKKLAEKYCKPFRFQCPFCNHPQRVEDVNVIIFHGERSKNVCCDCGERVANICCRQCYNCFYCTECYTKKGEPDCKDCKRNTQVFFLRFPQTL